MISKPSFIIWVSIATFILTILSDYYGYKTKLAVNNFAEDRGKNQIIEEAKFPNDYGNTKRLSNIYNIRKAKPKNNIWQPDDKSYQ